MEFNQVSFYNGLRVTTIEAAEIAGDFLIRNLFNLKAEDIRLKSEFDYVTRIDEEAEQLIIRTIKGKYPDHLIFTEESTKDKASGGYRWIIDPIDGTTNYIHGYPFFSVSIAVQFNDAIIIGVVFNPISNELFVAEKGRGALLNGKPIAVSDEANIKNSLLLTGFPFRHKERLSAYLDIFEAVFMQVSDLRRMGSAALDLAYVAAGRADGFFEMGLNLWDIAAGSLLLSEAGGIITNFDGSDDLQTRGDIIAGTPNIHKAILSLIKTVA